MVLEPLAAEVGLGQAVPLDEGSGGAVEHQDSVLQKRPEQEQALSARPRVACRLGWGDLCGRSGLDLSVGGPASFLCAVYPPNEFGPRRGGRGSTTQSL
jgi:hypothetical protein